MNTETLSVRIKVTSELHKRDVYTFLSLWPNNFIQSFILLFIHSGNTLGLFSRTLPSLSVSNPRKGSSPQTLGSFDVIPLQSWGDSGEKRTVVVSSPLSFSGAPETRMSKAPVKVKSGRENILFRKMQRRSVWLDSVWDGVTGTPCSLSRLSWISSKNYVFEAMTSSKEWVVHILPTSDLRETPVLLFLVG